MVLATTNGRGLLVCKVYIFYKSVNHSVLDTNNNATNAKLMHL